MLARSTATYMIAHVTSALVGFIGILLYTRMLSPAEYGLMTIGQSTAAIITASLFAWIRVAVMRFAPERNDIGINALTAYVGGLAVLPGIVILLCLTPGMDAGRATLIVALASAASLFEISHEMLKSRMATGHYLWSSVLRSLLMLGLSLAAIALGFGGMGMLGAFALSYVVTALAVARWTWTRPWGKPSAKMLRMLLWFGLPFAAAGMVATLSAVLDRLIIAAFLGEEPAGNYGAAADFTRQIMMIPAMSVGAAIVPIAVRLYVEGGRDLVLPHLRDSGALLIGMLMPAAIGLACVAVPIADVVFGEAFRADAGALIPVMGFTFMTSAIIQYFLHVGFHLQRKTGLLLLQSMGVLAANAGLTGFAVANFGLIGGTYGALAAEVLSALSLVVILRNVFPLPAMGRDLAVITAASLAMGLVVTGLVQAMGAAPAIAVLIVAVPAGMATYGVIIALTNVGGIGAKLAGRFGLSHLIPFAQRP